MKKWLFFFLGSFLCLLLLFFLFFSKEKVTLETYDFVGMTKEEVEQLQHMHGIEIAYSYEPSKTVSQNRVIRQEERNGVYTLVLSLGDPEETYRHYQVNELGRIPIMMYHGIVNETPKYIGGNIDKDGYQRSEQAFREDLEFYYQEGYRMIRLIDYIHGTVDVPLGKSPIILTFDDGSENNFLVRGKDEQGNLILEEHCAVAILEEFKKKYPDFQVTATFFINQGLFQQEEYNKDIISWLEEHGYDIGNHSYSHADFSKLNAQDATSEIAKQYLLLEQYTKNYVPIVALPFGSPYAKTHPSFSSILKGTYNQFSYETESTLRVGWESELSPFHKNFDKTFLKRIRAYDNNGKDFDLKMNFDLLKTTRYISDGNKKTITVPKEGEKECNSQYRCQTYDVTI